jgi:hypothetical protein
VSELGDANACARRVLIVLQAMAPAAISGTSIAQQIFDGATHV